LDAVVDRDDESEDNGSNDDDQKEGIGMERKFPVILVPDVVRLVLVDELIHVVGQEIVILLANAVIPVVILAATHDASKAWAPTEPRGAETPVTKGEALSRPGPSEEEGGTGSGERW